MCIRDRCGDFPYSCKILSEELVRISFQSLKLLDGVILSFASTAADFEKCIEMNVVDLARNGDSLFIQIFTHVRLT